MNRTIKQATVKRYHYDTHQQLETHLTDLRQRLQLRTKIEDPARPHTLRAHLQSMGRRAPPLHVKPAPPNAGTEHLGRG